MAKKRMGARQRRRREAAHAIKLAGELRYNATIGDSDVSIRSSWLKVFAVDDWVGHATLNWHYKPPKRHAPIVKPLEQA